MPKIYFCFALTGDKVIVSASDDALQRNLHAFRNIRIKYNFNIYIIRRGDILSYYISDIKTDLEYRKCSRIKLISITKMYNI
jgi:hypothetical protein